MLIHNLAIFWAPAYLEVEAYLKPSERLSRHIQNIQGIIQPYSGIFRTLCNTYICRNLTYSKSWNIQNPSIIISQHKSRTLSYLQNLMNVQNSDIFKKPDTYSEPSQSFKMKFFAKIVKNYTYFSKAFHHRSLTKFWICNLSISTH